MRRWREREREGFVDKPKLKQTEDASDVSLFLFALTNTRIDFGLFFSLYSAKGKLESADTVRDKFDKIGDTNEKSHLDTLHGRRLLSSFLLHSFLAARDVFIVSGHSALESSRSWSSSSWSSASSSSSSSYSLSTSGTKGERGEEACYPPYLIPPIWPPPYFIMGIFIFCWPP